MFHLLVALSEIAVSLATKDFSALRIEFQGLGEIPNGNVEFDR
jgi:hypothetical protein